MFSECSDRQLGINAIVADKILNHQPPATNRTARIYNRAKYPPKQVAALDRWAAHVEKLIKPPRLRRPGSSDDRCRSPPSDLGSSPAVGTRFIGSRVLFSPARASPARIAWFCAVWRWRRQQRVLHANEEPLLPGRHITDCQMRLYFICLQAAVGRTWPPSAPGGTLDAEFRRQSADRGVLVVGAGGALPCSGDPEQRGFGEVTADKLDR